MMYRTPKEVECALVKAVGYGAVESRRANQEEVLAGVPNCSMIVVHHWNGCEVKMHFRQMPIDDAFVRKLVETVQVTRMYWWSEQLKANS